MPNAVGIPSSRQSARELEEIVAFRVLATNQRPDFRTISDFRQQHLAALTVPVRADTATLPTGGLGEAGPHRPGWDEGEGECLEA
jgi:hypothetical protein